MIVAVEGPIAAGKTTWCRRQPWPVVEEYRPTGAEPAGRDARRAAAFWVDVGRDRWREALSLEQGSAVVLCDSDPLKLHYAWGLARLGEASWSQFDEQLRHTRTAIIAGRLGFADLVLVEMPSTTELDLRRSADRTRRRGSFSLHVRLREPLREWYAALERARPGTVSWSFAGRSLALTDVRKQLRYDVELLDRLVLHLPDRAT